MTEDFRFQSPPLVEVIVEIHWALKALTLPMKGLAIDPHFDVFQPAIAAMLERDGYSVHESLRPEGVPLELLGHRVTNRYRKRAGAWPVVQVGPGVMTVNIVPPYDGWNSFRPIVSHALGLLFASYPLPAQYLKVESLQLRYLDVFTATHGFDGRVAAFVENNLNLGVTTPEFLLTDASDANRVTLSAEWSVPLGKPFGATGSIKVVSGKAADQEGVIADFSVLASDLTGTTFDLDGIGAWLDTAHDVVRGWFMKVPKQSVLDKMGERIPI